MALNTITLDTIETRLSQQIGDWLSVDTTTNITTNTSVISTTLNQYDSGEDDYFNDWWCYITDGNNSGTERRVSDYATATGTLTLYGANLSAETGAVAFRLYRNPYSRTEKLRAINDTIRELYPQVFTYIENRELVTGNICPPFIFPTSSTLNKYTTSSATVAEETTIIRRGAHSLKVTASAANGYVTLKSTSYPRLLTLQNQTVTAQVWAYPNDAADDAYVEIYTKQADGTAQTLTSDTSNPSGEFSLIQLKDQTLNDNLTDVEIRLKVATNGNVVYFEHLRVNGRHITEYIIPQDFVDGEVRQVFYQITGHGGTVSSSQDYKTCDDAHPYAWQKLYNWRIFSDGTDEFLRLPEIYPDYHQLRLVGVKPFSTLSTSTDTVTLEAQKANYFVAYAKYCLFRNIAAKPSIQDTGRFKQAEIEALSEANRLAGHPMTPPRKTIRF